MAQAMADAGHISPEAVRHHAKRNALTNFLGGHNGKVKADLRWLRLADGDRLLLCSDGLNEMVDDASIARILGRRGTIPATRPSPCSMRPSIAAARTTSRSSWPSYRIPEIASGKLNTLVDRSFNFESTSDSLHSSLAVS